MDKLERELKRLETIVVPVRVIKKASANIIERLVYGGVFKGKIFYKVWNPITREVFVDFTRATKYELNETKKGDEESKLA